MNIRSIVIAKHKMDLFDAKLVPISKINNPKSIDVIINERKPLFKIILLFMLFILMSYARSSKSVLRN